MFIRLLELLLALYYGTLEVPSGSEGKEQEEDKQDGENTGEQNQDGK